MTPYTLKVNGQYRSVTARPNTSLLEVLRELLDLRGTKHGCTGGGCGSCTVHIDGLAVRSCGIHVSDIKGRVVTTIEGLDPTGNHPLLRAWDELGVSHCGFCQSGQIMSAASLLGRNPNPTDAEIEQAMAGNACRCGTNIRVRAGIRYAIKLAKAGSPTQ